jgi:hypothetical protein
MCISSCVSAYAGVSAGVDTLRVPAAAGPPDSNRNRIYLSHLSRRQPALLLLTGVDGGGWVSQLTDRPFPSRASGMSRGSIGAASSRCTFQSVRHEDSIYGRQIGSKCPIQIGQSSYLTCQLCPIGFSYGCWHGAGSDAGLCIPNYLGGACVYAQEVLPELLELTVVNLPLLLVKIGFAGHWPPHSHIMVSATAAADNGHV